MVSCETCLGLTVCVFLCSLRALSCRAAAQLQNTCAVGGHTWVLAAKEAFDAFLARLVWEGPAGAHGPLAREKSQRRTWRKWVLLF